MIWEIGCCPNQKNIDCFLLDDGFQHLGLYRDLDFLLVDGSDPDGLRGLLPGGRLREPLSAAGRASAIVITRSDLMENYQRVCGPLQEAMGQHFEPIQIEFEPQGFYNISDNEARSLSGASDTRAIIFSGIGNPGAFRSTVEKLEVQVVDEFIFSDHWAFSQEDVMMVRERMRSENVTCAITTEKDAVKLLPYLTDDDEIWAIQLGVKVKKGEERLLELLTNISEGVIHSP